jgi:hypothetical protein
MLRSLWRTVVDAVDAAVVEDDVVSYQTETWTDHGDTACHPPHPNHSPWSIKGPRSASDVHLPGPELTAAAAKGFPRTQSGS